MLQNKKIQSGFTLIELLVVIAIIGILSTMAIVALGNARAKARDTKRVADLKQISTALELYYADYGFYPTLITVGQALTSPDNSKTYMASIPSNPIPRNDNNCPNLDYQYASNGSTVYSVMSCIGNSVGSLASGGTSISSSGAKNLGTLNGLVAYWALDESSGLSSRDFSDSHLLGTIDPAVQLGQVGKVGTAMRFNGSSTLIDYGLTPAIDISTGDFSVAAWFNTSSLSGYQMIFNKGTGFLIDGYSLFINNNQIQFSTDGDNAVGGQAILTSDSTINQDTWYHIVGVRRSGVKYLYINGQAQATTQADARELSDSTYSTVIGRLWANSSQYFNGLIDDVRVYNRALSDAEVQTIYDGTK